MTSRYFSRAELRPEAWRMPWLREAAGRGQVYRDHAAVWRLFPGDDMERDFLFRRCEGPGGSMHYYVVSHRKPEGLAGVLHVEAKPYDPRFQVGELVRFSLRANPTISRGAPGARSKRHDVLMDAKRRASDGEVEDAVLEAGTAWLRDRSERIGLELDPGRLLQDAYQQHRAKRGKSWLTFSSVDFDGIATVRDPGRLREALFNGVGHSKGFGCGLLMVRRGS